MKEDRQMVKMKRSKKDEDEQWEVEEEERVRTRFLGEQKVYFPSLNPWDSILNPWYTGQAARIFWSVLQQLHQNC